jgi:hypothetical protein
MAKVAFWIHSAVTIKGVGPQGLVDAKGKRVDPDKEIAQFCAEFKRAPIPESYFDKAFDEMKAACKQKAREAGLLEVK